MSSRLFLTIKDAWSSLQCCPVVPMAVASARLWIDTLAVLVNGNALKATNIEGGMP